MKNVPQIRTLVALGGSIPECDTDTLKYSHLQSLFGELKTQRSTWHLGGLNTKLSFIHRQNVVAVGYKSYNCRTFSHYIQSPSHRGGRQ